MTLSEAEQRSWRPETPPFGQAPTTKKGLQSSTRQALDVELCVPDLIVLLDVDTGYPITTEMLRYGQRVAVIAIPCHDLLRSARALEVVGPTAFGYPDIDFLPLPAPVRKAA